jgi:hypothetical protein
VRTRRAIERPIPLRKHLVRPRGARFARKARCSARYPTRASAGARVDPSWGPTRPTSQASEIRISKASRRRNGREKRGRNASHERMPVAVPLTRQRRSHLARGERTRRGVRPRHAARGRSRHLGGPRFSLATIRRNGEPVIVTTSWWCTLLRRASAVPRAPSSAGHGGRRARRGGAIRRVMKRRTGEIRDRLVGTAVARQRAR